MTEEKIKFQFHEVTQSRWPDFEKLFQSKGGPFNCWCMVWRSAGEEAKHTDKTHKKMYIKKRVKEKIPIGILAYAHHEPVGWCSIAPRDSYRQLGGDDSLKDVWSIVCFFIKKEFRGIKLTEKLTVAALQYAKKKGAKYVEAYPVEPDSPSYRFMGYKNTFEKQGFEFVKKAGKRRNVMTKKIT